MIVTGSHCGIGVAQYLAGTAVCGLLGNDAGVPADAVALATLDRFRVPAAVVSNASARIGRASDTLDIGRVSVMNAAAALAGLRQGMSGAEAAARMLGHPPVRLPEIVGYRSRRRLLCGASSCRIVLADSASLITVADAGSIIVTGSHGGLVGGLVSRGLRADAALAFFNDAGRGYRGAGIARLAALERVGVAAATIAAESARIGSALATWRGGVVSFANEKALTAGLRIGMTVQDAVAALVQP